jgi:hydroxymethylbilane synthase
VNPANPASTPVIRIVTRGSALALAQANMVLAQCRAAFPNGLFEIRIIKTTGDKLQTASLAESNLPKGLFTKELESALLSGEGDLAVHSLKDLPTDLPAGLTLGAVSKRADVRDVLICRATKDSLPATLDSLRVGATVATSSTRRRAQLLHRRPDLAVVEIRGNVGTRLRKLAEQPELDAIVLAAAGLERLNFRRGDASEIAGDGVPAGLRGTPLSIEEMLPCVGQAALGIETRENDPRVAAICAALNNPETEACVTAERAFLRGMGGGCQLAVGACAEITRGELRLRAISFLADRPRSGERAGEIHEAEDLGIDLAQALR